MDISFPKSHGEKEARFTLTAGVYAGRLTFAFIAFILALTNLTPSTEVLLQLSPEWLAVREIGLSLLVVLTILTALNVGQGLLGHIRHGKVPPIRQLTIGAGLDMVWLVWGYMASGYSGLPFPPLLILVIGVYGVLLNMKYTLAITAWACVLFVLAQGFGEATQPIFSSEAQAALFVGVGLVSAIVGNRIRAASATVERLGGALEKLNRYHQQVLEHLPAGVIVAMQGEGHMESNSRAQQLLGGESPESLEKHLPELAEKIQDGLEMDQEGVLEQGEENIDNGETRWINWTLAAHTVPNIDALEESILSAEGATEWGKPQQSPTPETQRAVIAVLGDITDQRRAEAMKAQTEKLRAIAELSAGLAHEVRNPTAALRLSAQQLAESPQTDQEDQQLADIIIRESNRLSDLVQEFLDFARVGEGEPSRVNLQQLIQEAIEVAQAPGEEQGEYPEIRQDIPDTYIRIDKRLAHRVLSNLLLNAFQFTPNDQSVEVAATIERKAEELSIQVRIRDHGPGIEPSRQDKIFSPFYTTRSGGSGLGLAVAARAASLLEGDIQVQDPGDAGSGAVLVFTFRAKPAPSGPSRSAQPATTS